MRTKKGLELDLVYLAQRLRESANGPLFYYRVVPHKTTANLFCVEYAAISDDDEGKEVWQHLITLDSQVEAKKIMYGLQQKFSKRAISKHGDLAELSPKRGEAKSAD